MQNDPDEFRDPPGERALGRSNGIRKRRSTFLISVSLLAVIGGGSWSGWQLHNGSTSQTVNAGFGSPYGVLQGQKSLQAPNAPVVGGLANELAKRAADANSPKPTPAAVITDARADEAPAPAAPAVPAPDSRPQQMASLTGAPRDAAIPAPAVTTASPVQVAQPVTPPAPAAPPPAAAAVAPPVPAPPPDIPADEQQEMLSRVTPMLREGDIAGARLILERLDRAGNGQASYALAQTYDPAMLSRWNVLGIRPDPAKATEYYKRALDEGVDAARDHLTASAASQR